MDITTKQYVDSQNTFSAVKSAIFNSFEGLTASYVKGGTTYLNEAQYDAFVAAATERGDTVTIKSTSRSTPKLAILRWYDVWGAQTATAETPASATDAELVAAVTETSAVVETMARYNEVTKELSEQAMNGEPFENGNALRKERDALGEVYRETL